MKKAVILFNLGGPDSLSAVHLFLFNLFYDRRIVNLPNPFRFLLAKFISKRRENTAQEIYEHIGGKSPILENTQAQADALECKLNEPILCHPSAQTLGSRKKHWIPASSAGMTSKVFICMRYWHPFADEVVKSVKQFDPDKIILLPLYPQYSTTTTLSSIENWQKNAKKYSLECNTTIINNYYDNEDFIEAHTNLTAKYYKLASKIGKPRVLFSAHSLPLSIIKKGDPYASQIEKTVKLIVKKLNIEDLDWGICYQSKVGPVKWLEPSTESELSRAKADDIPVVLSPISFVSEHSETLVELDIEYKAIIKDGYYFRVPTLSTDLLFIKCLADLCLDHSQSPDL
ncbi:ferrochelatase [Wolbachia endosymbiont of Tribolium confusum]|uniref:ferrochelatase n=1 Tax=Wolbachia endosymbiont of Tribolium confusum TaxID=214474 RepID=UPI001CF583A0|nr:ferrochelatase [Wolbachia endosymbiont of Tribolium confusum]